MIGTGISLSQPISRRQVIQGIAAGSLLGCTPSTDTGPQSDKPPNVVLLFPDQLRAHSLSCLGEVNIETPALDGLAASGVHFTQACSPHSLCTPARASLLSGLHSRSLSVNTNGVQLPEWAPTLSHTLDKAGYHCGYIGKWHLDGDETPGFVPPERRHGFSCWAATNFSHNYLDPVYFTDTPNPIRPQQFEPEHQTDLALSFMDANLTRPFFLMLSYGVPHPFQAMPSNWKVSLPGRYFPMVDSEAIAFRDNVPQWIREGGKLGARWQLWGYYAAILCLEEMLAKLRRGMEERGLWEDTIVVLASDHGEMCGSHGLYGKWSPYEEAIRVPLCFSWPRAIPRHIEHSFPTSLVDVAPTVLSLCGVNHELEYHGQDLSPWLIGDGAEEPMSVFSEGRLNTNLEFQVIRTKRYKYVRYPGWDSQQLFDLQEDPFEQRNVIDEDLGGEKALVKDEMKAWAKKIRATDV
ncbi:MAG: sulfatase [Proteobacteria bacterium]|nr:sulfatase [Pseudomonadota bacterium]